MTQRVPDSIIATFSRQQHDWMERVLKGSLDPVKVARAVQPIIDQGNNNKLVIDYGMSLEQMISAGNYDWKNSDLTASRFPVDGSGIVECEYKLSHFDRSVSSNEAVRLITIDGWQPGKIEHLLAFGAANPDEQRKFPIVALGSVAEMGGLRDVAFLRGGDAGRRLGLGWWGGGWDGVYRFLAVRA